MKRSRATPKKVAASKTLKRKVSASAAEPLFFGQGTADYHEWFELWVWFEKPVPRAERKALMKSAPAPCAVAAAEWPQPSLLWVSRNDRWLSKHLVNTYAPPKPKAALKRALSRQEKLDSPYDLDDDDEEALFAGSRELAAFNADIEAWLLATHAKRPIAFAARREDLEAGRTRLGAWHRKSVAKFSERVRPMIEDLAKQSLAPDDERRAPIAIVLKYVGRGKVSRRAAALGAS